MGNPVSDPVSNSGTIWSWWLSQLVSPVTHGANLANTFNEMIQPYSTFAGVVINENNSSDPKAERDIVSEESYGRQLGTLMDAVAALIDQRPATAGDNPAFDDLLELKAKIDKIKEKTIRHRFEQVKSDLARLRRDAPDTYRARLDELNALPPA